MDDEYVAGYDTAVLPILAWVNSNDWMKTYLAHAGDFYAELVEAADAPIYEILDGLPTVLWGRAARCSFDDFLTLEYESDPSNALDQYLDEVGNDLQNADVDYLIAFRNSVVRIYYVTSRTPYGPIELRDLSGGTRPIQIEDEMLTAALSAGDRIATRIVTVNDKDYLAGSILVLNDETLEIFAQAFETAFKEEMRNVEKYLQKDLRQRNLARQRVLKGAASVLSGMWVMTTLASLEHAPPLSNEDEPETVFQATIPYDSQFEFIVETLEAYPDLDRPIAKEFLWLWHNDRENPAANLKAMVWISGPDIFLESCERGRIEEAVGILAGLFGDSVEEATILEVGGDADDWDEWDGLDEDEEDDEGDEWLLPTPMTDEEESAFRLRVHGFLDHHLRSALDNPVPELKERIPRDLAKTVRGRKQLSKWLASVEAYFRANSDQVGFADYDFRWMWKELGMDTERQSSLFE